MNFLSIAPLYLILTVLAFAGCSSRYADFFPYHDNGTKKPFVTLLPVYDEIQDAKSEQFCDLIGRQVRNRLKRRGKVYCPPEALDRKVLQSQPLEELAHASNLEPFKKFKGSEYVCLVNVIEYSTVPYKRNTISPLYLADIDHREARVLMIAARLNIIDIRGPVPKFVRQEVVHSNHMIALDPNEVNMDMVRSRFARDLEEKIEQTVCVEK